MAGPALTGMVVAFILALGLSAILAWLTVRNYQQIVGKLYRSELERLTRRTSDLEAELSHRDEHNEPAGTVPTRDRE
jgi:cell division protein FtsB